MPIDQQTMENTWSLLQSVGAGDFEQVDEALKKRVDLDQIMVDLLLIECISRGGKPEETVKIIDRLLKEAPIRSMIAEPINYGTPPSYVKDFTNGMTPLQYAIKTKQLGMVKRLLEEPSVLATLIVAGKDPILEYARTNSSVEVLEVIQDAKMKLYFSQKFITKLEKQGTFDMIEQLRDKRLAGLFKSFIYNIINGLPQEQPIELFNKLFDLEHGDLLRSSIIKELKAAVQTIEDPKIIQFLKEMDTQKTSTFNPIDNTKVAKDQKAEVAEQPTKKKQQQKTTSFATDQKTEKALALEEAADKLFNKLKEMDALDDMRLYLLKKMPHIKGSTDSVLKGLIENIIDAFPKKSLGGMFELYHLNERDAITLRDDFIRDLRKAAQAVEDPKIIQLLNGTDTQKTLTFSSMGNTKDTKPAEDQKVEVANQQQQQQSQSTDPTKKPKL